MRSMRTIPVLVAIRANAHRDEGLDEPIAMFTSGELSLKKGEAVLHYQETLDESLPPQPVELVARDDTVTVTRGGEYETMMVFRKGYRYQGTYRTPYGDMELAVFCTRARYTLSPDGGEVLLSYQMDLNGQFAAMHDMELRLIRQDDA